MTKITVSFEFTEKQYHILQNLYEASGLPEHLYFRHGIVDKMQADVEVYFAHWSGLKEIHAELERFGRDEDGA